MSETLVDMAVAIAITAILALVVAFAIWRAVYHSKMELAQTKPLTLRISNIPGNITKERLGDILTDLAVKMSTSTGAADRPQLLGWSFMRSGHTERSFVATATFSVPPAPSQLESDIKCAMDVGSAHLRVDSDFFGLTPLAGPEDPAVE